MESVVIDLSSDDESSPSPKKKPRTMIPLSPSMRLQANPQLTVRQTKVVMKKSTTSTAPISVQPKIVDMKKGTQSILLPFNNARTSSISSKVNNNSTLNTNLQQQKELEPLPAIASIPANRLTTTSRNSFAKKYQSGEITIVPIKMKEPQASVSSLKAAVPIVKIDSKPTVIKSNSSDTNSNTNISIASITTIKSENHPKKPAKRVAPTKISDEFTIRANSIEKSSDSDMMSRDSSVATNDETIMPIAASSSSSSNNHQLNGNAKMNDYNNDLNELAKKRRKIENDTPINAEFQSLIDACRAAEQSDDMKKAERKLIKLYQSVHHSFVNSKSFRKNVEQVVIQIKAQPKLVYLKIKDIVEELKSRRLCDTSVVQVDEDESPELTESTGDKKKDAKLLRLSKALYKLKKLIAKHEEEEVDWDDEINSKFLITERYKKRAWEIYSKICDLTGESKNAERLVKKPIRFKATNYKEFNRKLERFINETAAFPDRYDVQRCLEYCNKEYKYGLSKEAIESIATDAFVKVGTDLQKRRKTDLYEMVDYYTHNKSDPATEDPMLRAKLDENLKKNKKKMSEIIDKFTRKDQGEDVDDLDASTSNNIRDLDEKSSPIKSNELPTEIKSEIDQTKTESQITLTTAKLEIVDDDNPLNISDDVVLIDEFFGEIARDIDKMPPNELDAIFQIESVESLHPSTFDNSQIQVIDDSL